MIPTSPTNNDMQLSREIREEVAGIFNGVMDSTAHSVRLSAESIPEFQPYLRFGLMLPSAFKLDDDRQTDPFYEIFSDGSLDLKNTKSILYHFKGFERATDILRTKSLELNTLFSNRDNDFAEYEEFYRRYGPLVNLIPYDFKVNSHAPTAVVPRNRPVDHLKERIFVICFTDGYEDTRFWTEYVRNRGVCFRMRIDNFKSDPIQKHIPVKRNVQNLYELRTVRYDTDGYIFDFLNEINYKLGQRFGFVMFNKGIPLAAQFYKRAKYSWERETRLSIDYEFVNTRYSYELEARLPIVYDSSTDRTFVRYPMVENRMSLFFSVELLDVFCSSDLTPDEVLFVERLVESNFSGVSVWPFEKWSAERPYLAG